MIDGNTAALNDFEIKKDRDEALYSSMESAIQNRAKEIAEERGGKPEHWLDEAERLLMYESDAQIESWAEDQYIDHCRGL